MNIRTIVALILCITISAVYAMDNNGDAFKAFFNKPRTSHIIIDGRLYTQGSPEAVTAIRRQMEESQRKMEEIQRKMEETQRQMEETQWQMEAIDIAKRAFKPLGTNGTVFEELDSLEYSEQSITSSCLENRDPDRWY